MATGLRVRTNNQQEGRRRQAADKIVIVTSQPKPNEGLLALVNMLFPDCEIEIVVREAQTFEQCQADSGSVLFRTDTIGRA